MGKKVLKRQYDQYDSEEFYQRVRQETHLLVSWCKNHTLENSANESGFELELFLLNKDNHLAHNNLAFIEELHREFLISEAANSTLEINTPYLDLHANALSAHSSRITDSLNQCQNLAAKNDQHVYMMGTLPATKLEEYTAYELTDENRYHAINNRLSMLRARVPTQVQIQGIESILFAVDNFAFVGAISSFQIHCRVPVNKIVRLYNTAQAISAAMIAISANSPYLFSKELWQESRIPFYEQILKTAHNNDTLPRVHFGHKYVDNCISELFLENYQHYSPLLPQLENETPDKLFHLRLHNGNIYRWNRPILDFNGTNEPYFRIEHRPLPAGPTILDMLANAAFYFGLANYFCQTKIPLEHSIPFQVAKKNFYLAARYGLDARIEWMGNSMLLSELILRELLPKAAEGLHQLDINLSDIQSYLSIIEARTKKNKTGSSWQHAYMQKHKNHFDDMMEQYLLNQDSGNPVHDWEDN